MPHLVGTLLVTSVGALVHAQAPTKGGECSGQPNGFVCPANGGCKAGEGKCSDDFEWQQWTTSHNLYRCMHGLPPVYWSTPMYDRISWAYYQKDDVQHMDTYKLTPPEGPAAENEAKTSSPATPFEIVSAWYSEVEECASFPGCPAKPGKSTSSFTAMQWQGVTDIGCFRGQKDVSGCWYKGSDTPTCETPNFGSPDKEYKLNIFEKAWPFKFCMDGFKQCGLDVSFVTGVDLETGLPPKEPAVVEEFLETPDVTFEHASALTSDALTAMVVAGVAFVAVVAVVMARRRKTNVPKEEANDVLLDE